MKKLIAILPLLFSVMFAAAQDVPRFAKYSVGESGCSLYLPGDPGEFEMTYSEDGSAVYTGEVTHGDFNFAVICVQFKEDISGESDEAQVELLTGYMDFLQGQFGVTGSAGYGKGHTLEDYPDAKGVIDYWEDAEGLQYAVKGWVDDHFIAVLLLYGEKEYPYFNAQQMFLDGFRFPEE